MTWEITAPTDCCWPLFANPDEALHEPYRRKHGDAVPERFGEMPQIRSDQRLGAPTHGRLQKHHVISIRIRLRTAWQLSGRDPNGHRVYALEEMLDIGAMQAQPGPREDILVFLANALIDQEFERSCQRKTEDGIGRPMGGDQGLHQYIGVKNDAHDALSGPCAPP
jgi:hypothetical protein